MLAKRKPVIAKPKPTIVNDRKSYTELFNVNILAIILDMSTWRTIKALCLTMRSLVKMISELQKQHVKFGAAYLYKRQVDTIKQLTLLIQRKRQEIAINSPDMYKRIKFHAFLSFGKTLVGLYLAKQECAKGGISLIFIPKTILESWKIALDEFFRGETTKQMKNRSIIICTDAAYKFLENAQLKDLNGKVFITHRYDRFIEALQRHNRDRPDEEYVDIRLIVVDEMSKNNKKLEEIHWKAPTILMGATIKRKGDAVDGIEVLSNDVVPTTTLEISTTCPYPSIKKLVKADLASSAARHTILILPDKHNEEFEIKGVNVYHCTQFNKKKYMNFTATGGVFVVNLQCVIEGFNFNHCDRLLVYFRNMSSSISLQRLQQLFGRVVRRSAIYSHINIKFIVDDYPVMIIRCCLMDINCNGYGVVAEYVPIINHIGIAGILKLTKLDRMLLFATPTAEAHSYDDSMQTSLSMDDLIKYKLL